MSSSAEKLFSMFAIFMFSPIFITYICCLAVLKFKFVQFFLNNWFTQFRSVPGKSGDTRL